MFVHASRKLALFAADARMHGWHSDVAGNLPPFTPTPAPQQANSTEPDVTMSPAKRPRPNATSPADAMSSAADGAPPALARNLEPNIQQQHSQQHVPNQQPQHQHAPFNDNRYAQDQSSGMLARMQSSGPPGSHPHPAMNSQMMAPLTQNQMPGHQLQSAPSFSGGSFQQPTSCIPGQNLMWGAGGGVAPALWQHQPVRTLLTFSMFPFASSWHLRGLNLLLVACAGDAAAEPGPVTPGATGIGQVLQPGWGPCRQTPDAHNRPAFATHSKAFTSKPT
jgi:hypothetical protein